MGKQSINIEGSTVGDINQTNIEGNQPSDENRAPDPIDGGSEKGIEDREALSALRNVLANLYPTQSDSRQIVDDAGIPSGRIEFSSAAIKNWDAILREAKKRDKIFEIVKVALQEYPDNPLLRELSEKGAVSTSAAPTIDKDLDWLSTEPADTLEKIMGKQSTLLPISFFEVGLDRSRSVARVKLANGAMGSGFLTAQNIFVTNNHVFKNPGATQGAVLQFNYQKTSTGLDMEPVEFQLDPENGFATSKEDDWTLVRVQGDANKDWGEIELRTITDYESLRYVNIIQHPSGGPKQIALYHNVVAYADENRIQYLTDTLPGSSGSPVFDDKWRVVALHHSGGWIVEPGTKKPVFRNEGININLVVEAAENF